MENKKYPERVYDEVTQLGEVYDGIDPDTQEKTEHVTDEFSMVTSVARKLYIFFADAIEEMDVNIDHSIWADTILDAEIDCNIGFENGWHESDQDHPSAMRARDLAEIDLLKWLCERQGIELTMEQDTCLMNRRLGIFRDISSVSPLRQIEKDLADHFDKPDGQDQ